MRPDEHKRKKNDLYKKKHGMKNTKGKVVSNQTSTDKPGCPSRNSGHLTGHNTEAKRISDDEEEEVVLRQFSKRKVESNWNRYDIREDVASKESSQEPSGADFQQLLSQKTSSLSQFRFKEEQIWDPVKLKNPPQLSVNCNDLLSAVVCIPLHERLNIEERHFEKGHLYAFEETANQCRHSYVETNTDNKDEEELKKGSLREELPLENHTCVTVGGSDTEVKLGITDSILTGSSINSFQKQAISADSAQVVVNNSNTGGIKGTGANRTNNDLKDTDTGTAQVKAIPDDLDELSGICDNLAITETHLDSKIQVAQFQPVVTQSADSSAVYLKDDSSAVRPKKFVKNLEDQLDELLNLDDVQNTVYKESSSNTKAQVVNATESTGCKQTEVGSSLEDWLDDILDE